MNKKFIIFDFDGTIMNTNEVIIASWQAAAMHYLGHELPRDDIFATFGETLPHTVSYLMPGEDIMEVCEFHRQYQVKHCDDMVTVFEGVPELLQELKERGHKLAVATSRRQRSFYEYMESFDMMKYFVDAVVMEDVSHHKPHPESILVAMEKLGAKPEETLMVGDTKFDMGCAKNAGVESALALWSHFIDFDELNELDYMPTYQIEKPADLLEIV